MTKFVPLEEIERELANFDRAQPKPIRFELERLSDIEMPTGDEWLVKGVLPREGVGTLFGESGAYKSFTAIDIAWHVATGARWAGRKVEPATVVYLAAEAPKGVRKRLAGARAMHGLGDPPLHLIGATLNLGTDDKDLAVMIADIEEQGVKPGFIIVDTLSASMGSGEEKRRGDDDAPWQLRPPLAALRRFRPGRLPRRPQRRGTRARPFEPEGQHRHPHPLREGGRYAGPIDLQEDQGRQGWRRLQPKP